MAPITDLRELLRSLEPVLEPGTFVFTSVPHGTDVSALEPIVTVREAEGLALILEEERARAAALPVHFRAAWISLSVHSGLDAIGLTAALATALSAEQISCNVVAGAFHDHLFVPLERAQDALDVLARLVRRARG